METLIRTYADKLIRAGLGSPEGMSHPLVGGLDDILAWNCRADETQILETIFKHLNINSLIFLRPREPYGSLLRFLAEEALQENGLIRPKDCETRTFLHDLPVIRDFKADPIIQALKKRKSVIISPRDPGGAWQSPAIVAHGTVSPEQAFVTVSSVCFAGFVKFFTDYLERLQAGTADSKDHALFDRIRYRIEPLPGQGPGFIPPPFPDEGTVYAAIIEAGKRTVEYGLVDSYFGNVSYCWNGTLYISQTGSSLDALGGCIDPVPLDGSSSAGLTASSELSAHVDVIERTGCSAILHGHPKFSVILSMDCDPAEKAVCPFSHQCHIHCPKKRFIDQTPIVPGEVGTGPTGLCNTLPPAIEGSGSAIVYGHGLFTTGKNGFEEAFAALLQVEAFCQKTYFEKVEELRRLST